MVLTVVLVSVGASFGAGTKFTLLVKDKVKSDRQSTDKDFENGYVRATDLDTEICTLTVKVKMRGDPSSDCQLEWAFISENTTSAESDGERVVFCTGKKKISLQNNVERVETLVADKFVYTTIVSNAGGSTDKMYGDVYEGFVVLLTSNGEILAMDASSKRYEKDEWIEKVRSFVPAPAKNKKNRNKKNK